MNTKFWLHLAGTGAMALISAYAPELRQWMAGHPTVSVSLFALWSAIGAAINPTAGEQKPANANAIGKYGPFTASMIGLIIGVILAVAMPVKAQTPPKTKTAVKVVKAFVFPVVHPITTLKGIAYTAMAMVTVVTDVAEKFTAALAVGAAKVDAAADAAADVVNPTPAPSPTPAPTPGPIQ